MAITTYSHYKIFDKADFAAYQDKPDEVGPLMRQTLLQEVATGVSQLLPVTTETIDFSGRQVVQFKTEFSIISRDEIDNLYKSIRRRVNAAREAGDHAALKDLAEIYLLISGKEIPFS